MAGDTFFQSSTTRLLRSDIGREGLGNSTIDADSINVDRTTWVSLECLKDLGLESRIIIQPMEFTPSTCPWKRLSRQTTNYMSSIRTVSVEMVPSTTTITLPRWIPARSIVKENAVRARGGHLMVIISSVHSSVATSSGEARILPLQTVDTPSRNLSLHFASSQLQLYTDQRQTFRRHLYASKRVLTS
jgi:hypothetical protein